MQFSLKDSLKLLAIVCFVNCSNIAFAQSKKSGEVGVFAGGVYYLGDWNKIPFVETNLSAGVTYRHTIDTRLAITGRFVYGTLSGNEANSNIDFPNDKPPSFKNSFYELSGVFEYNFIRFLPAKKKYFYTPYVFVGLGYFYYPGGESKKFIFNIPFGVGVKYNINSNFILGATIGMRKTFNDDIDFEYTPPTQNNTFKQYGYAGNNDWYTVFGVSLSYKIKYRVKCPAFD